MRLEKAGKYLFPWRVLCHVIWRLFEDNTLFGGMYRLHLHDRKRKPRNKPGWSRSYPRRQNFIITAVRTSDPTSALCTVLELETPGSCVSQTVLPLKFIIHGTHSLVAITTGWTAGFRSLAVEKDIYPAHCDQTGPGAHPAPYSVCTGHSFPGRKQGRGVDFTTDLHLLSRCRMVEAYLHVFMAWWLIKHWESFTFSFIHSFINSYTDSCWVLASSSV
jgi:hypothetical protein